VVVFLLDQRHNQGQPVPFFGREAWTSRALALVAARSGCPVFGAWAWREGLGRHRFVVEAPLETTGDLVRDTSLFMSFYAAHIAARPASWLWLHDRWRRPKVAA